MQIELLGDSAALLRGFAEPAHLVAATLENLPGVTEAVASYDTVGLYLEPEVAVDNDFLDSIARLDVASLIKDLDGNSKILTVPVCYELGEDLVETARSLGLSTEELISHHASGEYRCYAIGFTPGFPYLGYLAPPISGLARRAEPRVRVEQGSVGITGNQTGIYPAAGPGGWNLIGRTPLVIVDLPTAYFPIAAGDIVRFHRIDEADFGRLEGTKL